MWQAASRIVGSLAIVVASAGAAGAQNAMTLVPQTLAARFGLERVWASRVEVDPLRARVESIVVGDGLLVAQTSVGMYQAIDAETGRTYWANPVGKPLYPSLPAGIGPTSVAACNGSMLYLFDRAGGWLSWQRPVDRVPSTGMSIGQDRVYLACLDGRIIGFPLQREDTGTQTPVVFGAQGVATAPPHMTEETVLWATDAGRMYCCNRADMTLRFMYRAFEPIRAPLAFRDNLVYIASDDGYVHCVENSRGADQWKFSVGRPVVVAPVVIDDTLYVITSPEGLTCLDAATGAQRWYTPRVARFLAASALRLYCADELGRLMVVDRASGGVLGMMDTIALSLPVANAETDRIYLATPTGLVQCLRERGLVQPIVHNAPPAQPASETPVATGDEQPAASEPPPAAPAADPFDPFNP